MGRWPARGSSGLAGNRPGLGREARRAVRKGFRLAHKAQKAACEGFCLARKARRVVREGFCLAHKARRAVREGFCLAHKARRAVLPCAQGSEGGARGLSRSTRAAVLRELSSFELRHSLIRLAQPYGPAFGCLSRVARLVIRFYSFVIPS